MILSLIHILLGAGESEKPLNFAYTVKAHAKVVSELIQSRFCEPVILYGHSLVTEATDRGSNIQYRSGIGCSAEAAV